jgi:hypothetical protein
MLNAICVFLQQHNRPSPTQPPLPLERGKVRLRLLRNEGNNYKPGVGRDSLLSGGC